MTTSLQSRHASRAFLLYVIESRRDATGREHGRDSKAQGLFMHHTSQRAHNPVQPSASLTDPDSRLDPLTTPTLAAFVHAC